MSLPLYRNARYRAEIQLSGIESWAGNGTVAEKLTEAGFTDVRVKGTGERRIAEGTWSKEDIADASHLVPKQVKAVIEIVQS